MQYFISIFRWTLASVCKCNTWEYSYSVALKEVTNVAVWRTIRQGSFMTLQILKYFRTGGRGGWWWGWCRGTFEACTLGGVSRHILGSLNFSWFPQASTGKFWDSTQNNLAAPANRELRLMWDLGYLISIGQASRRIRCRNSNCFSANVLRSVLGVTQFPYQRSSGVQTEHEDDLSRAFSGEDCDTKHCSKGQVQLQAGAIPRFPQTPSWHDAGLRRGDNLTVNKVIL